MDQESLTRPTKVALRNVPKIVQRACVWEHTFAKVASDILELLLPPFPCQSSAKLWVIHSKWVGEYPASWMIKLGTTYHPQVCRHFPAMVNSSDPHNVALQILHTSTANSEKCLDFLAMNIYVYMYIYSFWSQGTIHTLTSMSLNWW